VEPRPRPQISKPERKSIEHKSIENDDLFDSLDEINDFGADSDQEEIEKINPIYEDYSLREEIEYEDSILQEEVQQQLVKKKRKEIRVSSNMLLCLCNLL
jgi:hypothetical protein